MPLRVPPPETAFLMFDYCIGLGFLGLPPFRPFVRAAARLAALLDRPPTIPPALPAKALTVDKWLSVMSSKTNWDAAEDLASVAVPAIIPIKLSRIINDCVNVNRIRAGHDYSFVPRRSHDLMVTPLHLQVHHAIDPNGAYANIMPLADAPACRLDNLNVPFFCFCFCFWPARRGPTSLSRRTL